MLYYVYCEYAAVSAHSLCLSCAFGERESPKRLLAFKGLSDLCATVSSAWVVGACMGHGMQCAKHTKDTHNRTFFSHSCRFSSLLCFLSSNTPNRIASIYLTNQPTNQPTLSITTSIIIIVIIIITILIHPVLQT